MEIYTLNEWEKNFDKLIERVEKGVEIVKDEHDHGKIVKLDFGGSQQFCGIEQSFPMQEYGTIEFWYKTENTNLGGEIFSISDEFANSAGEPTNAVYGFTGFLCSLLEQTGAEHIGVAFDESLSKSYRNEI